MPSDLIAPEGSPSSAPTERLAEIQAQLRDIHPGAALTSPADPRLPALGWLVIILLAICLITLLGKTSWHQRRWARQLTWQGPDLVPRLQTTLRAAALARWPEARTLQGDAWLRWLDERGGSHFHAFAREWPLWLYGQGEPDAEQRAQLRRAYLRWGRRCVSAPRIPFLARAPRRRAP
ncbi:DUF4381 domain-containing protein [Aeromonas veronii]|uniref:DUF4381 domain-containing protein n=1 Tax=Aeromonas TaxID=642 RepID=UPI0032EB129A